MTAGLSSLTRRLLAVVVLLAHVTSAEAESTGSLWDRDLLTGDWGGVRPWLGDQGLTLSPTYVGETLSTVDGGRRRRTIYEGRLDVTVELDTRTAFDWPGGLAHLTAYQHHFQGISACCIGNYMTASNIEARPTTRLYTVWYQQSFLEDRASARIGQLAVDDEFVTSAVAQNFLNGTFGWWALGGADLPSGGAAYPLPTPAARLQLLATPEITVLAGAFAGDPAGPRRPGEPQQRNADGMTFSFSGGSWLVLEGQYGRYPPTGPEAAPLVLKLGGWYHTGDRFPDQRRDADGRMLAVSAAGSPRLRQGLWGTYGVAEGRLWRPVEAEGTDVGLSGFLRLGVARPEDRAPVGLYVDAGLAYRGLLPSRPGDLLGIAVAYVGIGASSRAADRDVRRLALPSYPVRSFEGLIEVTYQIAVADWWFVQPDLQYVRRPAGGVPRSDADPGRIPDALVIGTRTGIRF